MLSSSQAPLLRLLAQMPLLSEDETEPVKGPNGAQCHQTRARPVFETDVSVNSYYHCLLSIPYYTSCYLSRKSLRDRTVFLAYQWLHCEHI